MRWPCSTSTTGIATSPNRESTTAADRCVDRRLEWRPGDSLFELISSRVLFESVGQSEAIALELQLEPVVQGSQRRGFEVFGRQSILPQGQM